MLTIGWRWEIYDLEMRNRRFGDPFNERVVLGSGYGRLRLRTGGSARTACGEATCLTQSGRRLLEATG